MQKRKLQAEVAREKAAEYPEQAAMLQESHDALLMELREKHSEIVHYKNSLDHFKIKYEERVSETAKVDEYMMSLRGQLKDAEAEAELASRREAQHVRECIDLRRQLTNLQQDLITAISAMDNAEMDSLKGELKEALASVQRDLLTHAAATVPDPRVGYQYGRGSA